MCLRQYAASNSVSCRGVHPVTRCLHLTLYGFDAFDIRRLFAAFIRLEADTGVRSPVCRPRSRTGSDRGPCGADGSRSFPPLTGYRSTLGSSLATQRQNGAAHPRRRLIDSARTTGGIPRAERRWTPGRCPECKPCKTTGE